MCRIDVGTKATCCCLGAACGPVGFCVAWPVEATITNLAGLALFITGCCYLHSLRKPGSFPNLKPLSTKGRIAMAITLPILGATFLAAPAIAGGILGYACADKCERGLSMANRRFA
jgi:hypothetical protein